MRQYLVRVHCCGPRWIVHVPAIEGWALAEAKNSIKIIARQMISSMTGVPVESFGMDLTEGCVLRTVEEFTAGTMSARRWDVRG